MMKQGLLGKKLGMTQAFAPNGDMVPVTVVEAGPCPVVQKKTVERDGYHALQLGFLSQKSRRTTKPRLGHFAKATVEPTRYLREFRTEEASDLEVGQMVNVEIFAQGDHVDVAGTSKGKGFQGGMKRHGWRGGPASHGSTFRRAPGSIGASASPSRVLKGHPLPGHMGDQRKTVRCLKVFDVIPTRNLLLLEGAVPGAAGGLLEIRKSGGQKPS